MSRFARLFDLEDGEQVLVHTIVDDDESYGLNVVNDFGGMRVESKLKGMRDEETMMKALDAFTLDSAREYRQMLVRELGGVEPVDV